MFGHFITISVITCNYRAIVVTAAIAFSTIATVKNKEHKHNAELQRNDPGTKVTANSVTRPVISNLMPKMVLYYFHRFSCENMH